MKTRKTAARRDIRNHIVALSLSNEQKIRYGDICDAFHAKPKCGVFVGGRPSSACHIAALPQVSHGK